MFVAAVHTGKAGAAPREERAAAALNAAGIKTICPAEDMRVKRRGKFLTEKRVIFRGYVFIDIDKITPEIYNTITGTPQLIKILDYHVPLPDEERAFILGINKRDSLNYKVIRINKRKKYAIVETTLYGRPVTVKINAASFEE